MRSLTDPRLLDLLRVAQTVEDKIIKLQERKRSLAETTLGDGPVAGSGEARRRNAAGRLSDNDIMRLFGAPERRARR